VNARADWQAVALEETGFFGDVCAGISHDINNKLSVINEKAGLLEDLATALADGRPIDPDRFVVQSRKIVEQIRQAKQIVRNLNRFAHSTDVAPSWIDVGDVLSFVVALYSRKARLRETTLSALTPSDPVLVSTNLFALQNLIGRGIDMALSCTDENRHVTICATRSGDGLRVEFTGLTGLTNPLGLMENDQALADLLGRVGGRYRSQSEGTALFFDIPDHEPRTQGGTE